MKIESFIRGELKILLLNTENVGNDKTTFLPQKYVSRYLIKEFWTIL